MKLFLLTLEREDLDLTQSQVLLVYSLILDINKLPIVTFSLITQEDCPWLSEESLKCRTWLVESLPTFQQLYYKYCEVLGYLRVH